MIGQRLLFCLIITPFSDVISLRIFQKQIISPAISIQKLPGPPASVPGLSTFRFFSGGIRRKGRKKGHQAVNSSSVGLLLPHPSLHHHHYIFACSATPSSSLYIRQLLGVNNSPHTNQIHHFRSLSLLSFAVACHTVLFDSDGEVTGKLL